MKKDVIAVKVGESVEIPAEVEGLPFPKIEWSKGETLVEKSTDRQKIDTEVVSRTNALTKFSIPTTIRKDTDTYTITASNRLGTASQTVNINILGEETQHKKMYQNLYKNVSKLMMVLKCYFVFLFLNHR